MIKIGYKPSFVRQFKRLESDLQEEIITKIELFKDRANHKILKVHKLKGALKDFHSFSVNYKFRIVFEFETKNEAVLLSVGDHDIYK
ncbi:MAG: type II toxin-antitoxin system RelE/ParE family toxin [bacterium]|nr:type II toxin-antitoxin system RelE/ParE family toxin [bacterium]